MQSLKWTSSGFVWSVVESYCHSLYYHMTHTHRLLSKAMGLQYLPLFLASETALCNYDYLEFYYEYRRNEDLLSVKAVTSKRTT